MRYLAIGASVLVGVVFLASSVSKLAGRNAFRDFTTAVADTRVLPTRLVQPVAVLVVVAEFAVWILLAIPGPATTVAGLLLAAGLLVGFAASISLALQRGVRALCRCFGYTARPFGLRHVVRNVALALAALAGAIAWTQAGPAAIGGMLVALSSGLLAAGLVMVLDDLVDLFRPVHVGRGPAAIDGG